MNPILDKISQATKMIAKYTKAFEITRTQALEDGVIDDDEQRDLDELQAQISELETIVQEHKATLAANIAEWKALAGEYATFKTQIAELQEKGNQNVASVAETAVEIDRLEKEYFWKDATTAYQAAKAELAPLYQESEEEEEIAMSESEMETHRGEVNQMDTEIGDIEAEMDELEAALSNEMETEE